MSELIKTDVTQFVVNHTTGFEKEPPGFIWEKVRESIPEYKKPFPWMILSASLVFLVGVTVATIFMYSGYSGSNLAGYTSPDIRSNAGLAERVFVIETIVSDKSDAGTTIVAMENVPNQTTTTQTGETTVKISNYELNAAGLPSLSSIQIANQNDKVFISQTNPKPNGFGYYNIDVSKLTAGTYKLILTPVKGEKIVRDLSIKDK